MGYAHERLGRAISYLNADTGRLRDRLSRAATELWFEGSDGLRDDERNELEAIRGVVASEGGVDMTISNLADNEAYDLSARIHALYWRARHDA